MSQGDEQFNAGHRGAMEWQPIETAPKDGTKILVYRPLACKSGDERIAIKRSVGVNMRCWESTVPKGFEPINYTDGACYPTHWMPLPQPPEKEV